MGPEPEKREPDGGAAGLQGQRLRRAAVAGQGAEAWVAGSAIAGGGAAQSPPSRGLSARDHADRSSPRSSDLSPHRRQDLLDAGDQIVVVLGAVARGESGHHQVAGEGLLSGLGQQARLGQ